MQVELCKFDEPEYHDNIVGEIIPIHKQHNFSKSYYEEATLDREYVDKLESIKQEIWLFLEQWVLSVPFKEHKRKQNQAELMNVQTPRSEAIF